MRRIVLVVLSLVLFAYFSAPTIAGAQVTMGKSIPGPAIGRLAIPPQTSNYQIIKNFMTKWGIGAADQDKLISSSWRVFHDTRKFAGAQFALNFARLQKLTSSDKPASMDENKYNYLKTLKEKWFDILYAGKSQRQLGFIAYNISVGPSLFAARAKNLDGRIINIKDIVKTGALPAMYAAGEAAEKAAEENARAEEEAEKITAKIRAAQETGPGKSPAGVPEKTDGKPLALPGADTSSGGGGSDPCDQAGNQTPGDPNPVDQAMIPGSGGSGGWFGLIQQQGIQVGNTPLADPCGNITGLNAPLGGEAVGKESDKSKPPKYMFGESKTDKGNTMKVSTTYKDGKTSVYAALFDSGGKKLESQTKQKTTTDETAYTPGQDITVIFQKTDDKGTVDLQPPPPPTGGDAETPQQDSSAGSTCDQAILGSDICNLGKNGDCENLESALNKHISPVASTPAGMPDSDAVFGAMGGCGGISSGVGGMDIVAYLKMTQEVITNWGPDGQPETGDASGDACKPDPLTGQIKDPAGCCASNPEKCGSGGMGPTGPMGPVFIQGQ